MYGNIIYIFHSRTQMIIFFTGILILHTYCIFYFAFLLILHIDSVNSHSLNTDPNSRTGKLQMTVLSKLFFLPVWDVLKTQWINSKHPMCVYPISLTILIKSTLKGNKYKNIYVFLMSITNIYIICLYYNIIITI